MKKTIYIIIAIAFIILVLVSADRKNINQSDIEYEIEELQGEIDYLKEENSGLESKLEEARSDLENARDEIYAQDEYILELEALLDENGVEVDKNEYYFTDENGNLVSPSQNNQDEIKINKDR